MTITSAAVQRVVEIAILFEEKAAIPAVEAQLAYLSRLQSDDFWWQIDRAELEDTRLRRNQPLSPADLERLEVILVAIGEADGKELLTGLLKRSQAPTLAYFAHALVGIDRSAAQSAISGYLADRSLPPQQMRFVEMVIDQLTVRGAMEADALYESHFSNLHAGGSDELFAGHEAMIEGIFDQLRRVKDNVLAMAG